MHHNAMVTLHLAPIEFYSLTQSPCSGAPVNIRITFIVVPTTVHPIQISVKGYTVHWVAMSI